MSVIQIGGDRAATHIIQKDEIELRLSPDGDHYFLTIHEGKDGKRKRVRVVMGKIEAMQLLQPLLGSVNLNHIHGNNEVVKLALMIAAGHKAHHQQD